MAHEAAVYSAWRQVRAAADKSGRVPVLWFRKDREDWRVYMTLEDVMETAWGRNSGEWNDFEHELVCMTKSAFFKLALEESYRTFFRDPNRHMAACQECGGSGTTSKEIKDPTGFPYSVDVEVTCRACKGAGEV